MQNSTIKLSAENSGVVKPQLLAQSTVNAKVLQLINGERRKVGAPPLRVNSQLTQAAQRHANDMAENDFLSHTGSDGSTMRSRIEATGYSWGRMGENVAAGQATPEAVMRSWMSSPPHRGNILNRDFTEVGIGYATEPSSQYTHYWTLVFAKPR
ncbi:MAG: CAP domain-containing protein [Coleofasciculus sp. S288]|nr:CAP domain-containing protein [Coleofasciculus sp. S288]